MSRKEAEILLFSVVIARSTAFVFSKILLKTMSQFNIMSLRFSVEAIILFSNIYNSRNRGVDFEI